MLATVDVDDREQSKKKYATVNTFKTGAAQIAAAFVKETTTQCLNE